MNTNLYQTLCGSLIVTLLGAFFFSSCVSVKLGDSSIQKSDRYSFTSPSTQYRVLKDKTVDVAWIQKETGSTLSVKTKCQKGLDIDLAAWVLELSESLNTHSANIKVDKTNYNGRKAVQSIFDSEIEGFKNKLAVTSFIKNSCQYIIALTALSSNFDQDLPEYQKFLQGFKAW
ncbi:MAG: hypothetical protein M9899_11075 [Bdellovibrionaceae bacterium]|nr:hypothetical protein [Pseudobdellovibrionaceae bacterium]